MSSMLFMGRATHVMHVRHALRNWLSCLLLRIAEVYGAPMLQCRPAVYEMLPVVLKKE